MAKQFQNPSGIADFQKATFSFWFRIPDNDYARSVLGNLGGSTSFTNPDNWAGGIELLSFGDTDDGTGNNREHRYSTIRLDYGDWNAATPLATAGVAGHVTLDVGTDERRTDYCLAAWFGSGPSVNDASSTCSEFVNLYDEGGAASAYLSYDANVNSGHMAYLPSFTFDQWHHVMIAADLSSPDIFGNFPATDASDNHVYDWACSSLIRNKIIEIYFDKTRKTGIYMSTGDATASYAGGGAPLSNFVAGGWNIAPVSPASSCLISGKQISLSGFSGFTYNPEIKYAEFQAWFGQYIDPAAHMSKFVSSSGKPVDASVPQAAFGKPTIRFRRNKTKKLQFYTNDGTGGAFSKSGGITDFSPGP